jgi:cytochrome c oxidase accessory protein FixG
VTIGTKDEAGGARPDRASPFSAAPEQDLLYSQTADGSRKWIDPIVMRGRFWKIRVGLGWVMIGLFVALPQLTIAGKPGVFLDLARRQFTFFGVTFHPTDNLVLLAFGAVTIVTGFVVTALFGRLWCGYGCPHPIYLEFVFRPIERFLEGKPAAMRRRNKGPWTAGRAARKGAKWAIFVLISLLLSMTFVSYFVGWDALWFGLLHDPGSNKGALFAWLAISLLVFFNFVYFRDQMCTVACPYGRLQTVLYDPNTIIVGYDAKRGEPRKKKPAPGDPAGDCIDCGLCVRTCPTGMDIRRGLQMECIGCAQCIEACDKIMLKVGRPPGLIRYTSLRELETGESRFLRFRVFIYGALFLVALGALTNLIISREVADIEVLRGGREPYRLLSGGDVANILRIRVTNREQKKQSFTVKLLKPKGQLVVSQSPFSVPGGKIATLDVVARVNVGQFKRGQASAVFMVQSDAGFELKEEFVLLGPYN